MEQLKKESDVDGFIVTTAFDFSSWNNVFIDDDSCHNYHPNTSRNKNETTKKPRNYDFKIKFKLA